MVQLHPVIKAQATEIYITRSCCLQEMCSDILHSWQCVLPLGPNPVAHDIDSISIIWPWDGKTWPRAGTEAGWVYPSLTSLLSQPVCCGNLERAKVSLYGSELQHLLTNTALHASQVSPVHQCKSRTGWSKGWTYLCILFYLEPLLTQSSPCLGVHHLLTMTTS